METQPPPVQTTIPEILPPVEDRLQTLLELYGQLKEAEAHKTEADTEAKKAKDREEDLALRLIPAVMADLGLKELRMADGRTLAIIPQYYGSVAQPRMAQAVQWLEARNMDGIVKRELVIHEWNGAELQQIAALGVPYAIKQTIHPSTLRAFVRERLEANEPDFPKELFAASVVNRAVLSDHM